jgi:hypothetical protein
VTSACDKQQSDLWTLVHSTLRPKPSDPSPNACLNRLINERLSSQRVSLNPETAVVCEEHWPSEDLAHLDRWHTKMHDFDDDRPIVVVQLASRKILIDGNHRVTRWLSTGAGRVRPVLLIRPRTTHGDG